MDVRELIDQFIPKPHIRERHVIAIRAPAPLALAVARSFPMQSLALIRLIVATRALLLRGRPPVDEAAVGLMTEMRSLGWGVLADVPNQIVVAGAACQPWIGDVVFTPIAPDAFIDYAEPDCVTIAWTLEAMPLGPQYTRFASETRVRATDATAHRKFLSYWRRYSIGIVTIRWLLLRAIRAKAERRWRDQLRVVDDGAHGLAP